MMPVTETHTVIKRCPICLTIWQLTHNHHSTGKDWTEADFSRAFAVHVLKHSLWNQLFNRKFETVAYEYGKQLQKEAV